ncbi:MAG: class I SAM-dependent methyltransferase [Bacteroidetes bacterium]|nr:class I SAM-dependent methyltransferase [Bacteroidota bacterium]
MVDALVVMKYLKKRVGKYYLLTISSKFLVKKSSGYLDGLAELLVHPVIWESMGELPKSVKKETTALDQYAKRLHDFEEDFARFSLWISQPVSNSIGDLIKIEEYKQETRILDVACSSGVYGFTLATRNPFVRVVCVDRPNILEFAKEKASVLNLEKRVEYVSGDIFDVEFGSNFDIAIASFIFHNFDLERCAVLAKRIARALKPNGTFVLHDYIPDKQRSNSYEPLMFSVLMLATTRGGDAYTFSQYKTI